MNSTREEKEKERLSVRPLDEEEIADIRQFIEEWQRYKWMWSFVGRLFAWVGGVITVVWAGRDVIHRIFKAVFIDG